ncbi:MAG: hypothetical protein RBS80_18635 [Thermoguttaceae bacterium]|jgi:hypothetical protein|nr:hypothetical protein [Thermoguttaceae bacterium]
MKKLNSDHTNNSNSSAVEEADQHCPNATHLAPESEGLEPLIVGDCVIGYESDINGLDAELVDFRPTRAELRTLAHHYLDRYFTVQREFYARGQSGTWEIREDAFTWRRFCAIAEALTPGKTIQEFQEYIESKQAEVEAVRREFEETPM